MTLTTSRSADKNTEGRGVCRDWAAAGSDSRVYEQPAEAYLRHDELHVSSRREGRIEDDTQVQGEADIRSVPEHCFRERITQ